MTTFLLQSRAGQLPLPDHSVDCVVTSPPYYGLRVYKAPTLIYGGEACCAHEWNIYEHNPQPHGDDAANTGLGSSKAQIVGETTRMGVVQSATCVRCGAWRGQLGLEPTPELYLTHLVAVFREVRRVLKPWGTLWLNMGDSYTTGSGGDRKVRPRSEERARMRPLVSGHKPKDLMMMPHRLALALQADGWWVRQDIVWAKGNPMPESVRDRPTRAHEYIFLLSKSARYYYDADAIREPNHTVGDPREGGGRHLYSRKWDGKGHYQSAVAINPAGRNKRSVWRLNTQPYPGAHFATFPVVLPELCIRAGTSEVGVCSVCGKPWERVVERNCPERPKLACGDMDERGVTRTTVGLAQLSKYGASVVRTFGWRSTCDCGASPRPALVLDPFGGAGATAIAAQRLGRDSIILDISPEYLDLARQRLLAQWEKGETPLDCPDAIRDTSRQLGLFTDAGNGGYQP